MAIRGRVIRIAVIARAQGCIRTRPAERLGFYFHTCGISTGLRYFHRAYEFAGPGLS
ncbi:MAG: hypothetical protein IT443_02505 [Phycisphaeraceae bacterium]|nr:hypothetical protein [Phycisphaeraceae bacterium]